MTFTKDAEKQDNENYSKNFTRVPNIVFVSYKHLTKEEKFLYCTLRQVYWDMKGRFVSLRELNELTDYSIGALAKMLPRLHDCGLIHAEVKREKGKDGKEKGKAKYYISIPDIWELNRQFFASSAEQQAAMDPSLKFVHQTDKVCSPNERVCSPNDTSLFTKQDDVVPFGEQTQAQVERAKDSIKDTLKERMKDREPTQQKATVSTQDDSHSLAPSLSLSSETKAEVVFTQEQQAIYTLADNLNLSLLKRDEKHKEHCSKLIAKGVTTQEQMESLMAFSRQKLSSKGAVDLCLGNLVREVNGWLQLQAKPKACTVVETARPYRDAAAESLAKQDEVMKRIQEQEKAQGRPQLTLKERMAAFNAKQKAEAQQNSSANATI